jgi:hypothetical protein
MRPSSPLVKTSRADYSERSRLSLAAFSFEAAALAERGHTQKPPRFTLDGSPLHRLEKLEMETNVLPRYVHCVAIVRAFPSRHVRIRSKIERRHPTVITLRRSLLGELNLVLRLPGRAMNARIAGVCPPLREPQRPQCSILHLICPSVDFAACWRLQQRSPQDHGSDGEIDHQPGDVDEGCDKWSRSAGWIEPNPLQNERKHGSGQRAK